MYKRYPSPTNVLLSITQVPGLGPTQYMCSFEGMVRGLGFTQVAAPGKRAEVKTVAVNEG